MFDFALLNYLAMATFPVNQLEVTTTDREAKHHFNTCLIVLLSDAMSQHSAN